MFNAQFVQSIATKSTDYIWVAFVVLAKDFEKTNTTLAIICLVASVIVVLANATLKALLAKKTLPSDAE